MLNITLNRLEQIQFVQEFEHDGALTARDDQPILGLFPVGRLSNLKGLCANLLHHASVLGESTLKCQNRNSHNSAIVILALLATLGHQYFDFALVDAYHCLAEVFAQLCNHLCILVVGDSLNDGTCTLLWIARLEDT